jgi:hypothetical protein
MNHPGSPRSTAVQAFHQLPQHKAPWQHGNTAKREVVLILSLIFKALLAAMTSVETGTHLAEYILVYKQNTLAPSDTTRQ